MKSYPSHILNQVSEVILVLDAQWKVTYLNTPAAEELGADPKAVRGQTLWEIAPALQGNLWEQRFRKALHDQTPETFEALSPISGRCLQTRVFPTADGLKVYARDVTDARRLENELQEVVESFEENERRCREVNKELEERVVAQTALVEKRTLELRQLIEELGQSDLRQRAELARVLHDHLQQLLITARFRIRTLPDASTPLELKTRTQQVEVLLGRAIEELRSLAFDLSPPVLGDAGLVAGLEWLCRRMADKYGLQVSFHFDEDCEPGDDDLKHFLFQSARELLLNVATHARVPEADLRLSKDGAGYLSLVVSDAGQGVDPVRVKERASASGFGLFNIQQRVEILGGRFDIRSSPLHGCAVTVQVPTKDVQTPVSVSTSESKSTESRTRPSDDEGSSARTSVLIVDDHEILREGIVSLLESIADIEVIGQAGDGATAIEMTRDLQPDVVLMDITMPVMNGVEATRSIKAEMPGCHVIALSMHDRRDMAEAMQEAGASAYISKDAPWDELSSVIRKVVSSG